jgi:hypothetical protein
VPTNENQRSTTQIVLATAAVVVASRIAGGMIYKSARKVNAIRNNRKRNSLEAATAK